jgi:hypothetical protein
MTITLIREEAQQVEQYIRPGAVVPVDMQTTRLLVNALRTRLAQPEPEPELEVKFEQVADGIEVGYDFFGGVDIRLGGEFVYVHINYDPRYTHNAARTQLADKIVGLLTGNTTPPQREWQGLTDDEIDQVAKSFGYGYIDVARAIESKLKEKNR